MDFDTESSNIFLLKFASQMTLDERGLYGIPGLVRPSRRLSKLSRDAKNDTIL